MSSRREALADIPSRECHHAGLWLDKFIDEQAREDKESKKNLVLEVTEIKVPTVYDLFYQRWCEGLKKCGPKTKIAAVKGRLAIGLGDEKVLETSITLHRTYGVPYIPGSALKGLAASYTRQKLGEEWLIGSPSPYAILFGQLENAGYITFFDALYIPKSGVNQQPLAPDVMTVHHPNYYQQDNMPPADWDNPTPIHFLTATGQYLIALQGPDEWVETAFEILTLALKEVGIGAKTSSGYGRMIFDSASEQKKEKKEQELQSPEQKQVNALITELENMRSAQVAGSIYSYYQRWNNLPLSKAYKQQIAQAIVNKVRSANREKTSKGKGWYQELLASLSAESP